MLMSISRSEVEPPKDGVTSQDVDGSSVRTNGVRRKPIRMPDPLDIALRACRRSKSVPGPIRSSSISSTPWSELPSSFTSTILSPSQESITAVLGALKEEVILKDDLGIRVSRINNGRIVKYGVCVTIAEGLATEFVRRHTSIPAPVIHMVFKQESETYIVMDFLEGETLLSATDSMTSEDLKRIAIQLAGHVRQLRSMNPRTLLGSWPRGPYRNQFFEPGPSKEFRFIEEFHAYWWHRLETLARRRLPIPDSLRGSDECRAVLTHGDLSPRNILVKGSVITGILDWEALGWYPEYWEPMRVIQASSESYRQLEWPEQFCVELGHEMEQLLPYLNLISQVLYMDSAA